MNSIYDPTGPGARTQHGALLGTATVAIWNDIASEGRELFYEWHDKEHIPERLSIPGFLRGRRFSCKGHSPEWLTLYEARGLDVLTSPAYTARLNAPTEATTRTLKYFRKTSRAVCRNAVCVGNSSGGHVLALRIDVNAPGANDALAQYLAREVFPALMSRVGVVSASALAADNGASFINTAESQTRTFDVPSWVLLVEASTRTAASAASTALDGRRLEAMSCSVRPDGAVYTLEICRLPAQI
jgi:hypothetical protein